jgi:molybdenum cofactor cytidylyltransferase
MSDTAHDPASETVVGIVLAAGLSERMGGDAPKQLLRFGDLTMVAVTVGNAEASTLDRVVVVTGRAADEVAASIPEGRHEVVDNPDHAEGNLTSLRVGAGAAGEVAAVVVLLADMPGVATEVINDLVAMWRDEQPWAIVSEYADGEPNHPFLLSAAALSEALDRSEPKPLWALLVEDNPDRVARLRLTERPPVDVDTPGDYTEALRRRGMRSSGNA